MVQYYLSFQSAIGSISDWVIISLLEQCHLYHLHPHLVKYLIRITVFLCVCERQDSNVAGNLKTLFSDGAQTLPFKHQSRILKYLTTSKENSQVPDCFHQCCILIDCFHIFQGADFTVLMFHLFMPYLNPKIAICREMVFMNAYFSQSFYYLATQCGLGSITLWVHLILSQHVSFLILWVC